MKPFRASCNVSFTYHTSIDCEVEANSKEEAVEKINRMTFEGRLKCLTDQYNNYAADIEFEFLAQLDALVEGNITCETINVNRIRERQLDEEECSRW